jgi:hypothetical protein
MLGVKPPLYTMHRMAGALPKTIFKMFSSTYSWRTRNSGWGRADRSSSVGKRGQLDWEKAQPGCQSTSFQHVLASSAEAPAAEAAGCLHDGNKLENLEGECKWAVQIDDAELGGEDESTSPVGQSRKMVGPSSSGSKLWMIVVPTRFLSIALFLYDAISSGDSPVCQLEHSQSPFRSNLSRFRFPCLLLSACYCPKRSECQGLSAVLGTWMPSRLRLYLGSCIHDLRPSNGPTPESLRSASRSSPKFLPNGDNSRIQALGKSH